MLRVLSLIIEALFSLPPTSLIMEVFIIVYAMSKKMFSPWLILIALSVMCKFRAVFRMSELSNLIVLQKI